MKTTSLLLANETQYCPDQLFDKLHQILDTENDAELAAVLKAQQSTISRMRRRLRPVTASMIIKIHDRTGLAVRDIRFLMGDTKGYFDERRLPVRESI